MPATRKPDTERVIECFMLEWTGETIYQATIVDPISRDGCAANGGRLHSKVFPISEAAHQVALLKLSKIRRFRKTVPKYCDCGHSFACGQIVNASKGPELRDPRDGKTYLSCPPSLVGAMWDAKWLHDRRVPDEELRTFSQAECLNKIAIRTHPDGRVLVVNTPVGEWLLDGPTPEGKYWERTGEPPELSVRPAFTVRHNRDTGTPPYNAFLDRGFLIPTKVI